MAHAVAGIEFDAARMKAAMDPSLYATEQAYRMVRDEGISFRDAYRKVKEQLRVK
jgi:argininosuccinate lyase